MLRGFLLRPSVFAFSATLSVFWKFESLDGDLKGKTYLELINPDYIYEHAKRV